MVDCGRVCERVMVEMVKVLKNTYLGTYLGRFKMAACQCSLTNHRGTFSSIFRQEARLQIVPDSGAIASLNPCSSIMSSYIQVLPRSVST